jgi:hypothetical protein
MRIGADAAIGYKKQTTYTAFVTPDAYYRANTESFLPKYDIVNDDTLIANQLSAGQWCVGVSVEGSLEGPAFPDQLGKAFVGVLGGESAVADPTMAYLLVSYNGVSLYARLTKATGTLTAELSANGSAWSVDANFGTAGVIDLTAAEYDTLAELQAAIAGYTGYDCILCGSGATLSSTLVNFTATNLMTNDVNQGAYALIAANAAATDCKKHTLNPAASNAELPAWSFVVNRGLGTDKSFYFTGMTEKSFALNLGAKDVDKLTLSLVGRVEAVDQTDISIAVPTVKPYIVANCKIVVEDSTGNLTELTELKSLNITIDPALDDNRVIGDLSPAQPTRQQGKFELAITANATTAQYALISNYKGDNYNGIPISIYIYGKTDEYANATQLVPYSFFIRIPTFIFKDFSAPTSNKDRYVISMPGSVFKSRSTVYSNNFYCYVVDKLTATY